ncbi:hypothetical protein DL769_007171 [Monosporascus sp. CRB-8-3]|nr:hypothetical protein DL769_007171 [Monosporascus sp. CRB-8-3]
MDAFRSYQPQRSVGRHISISPVRHYSSHHYNDSSYRYDDSSYRYNDRSHRYDDSSHRHNDSSHHYNDNGHRNNDSSRYKDSQIKDSTPKFMGQLGAEMMWSLGRAERIHWQQLKQQISGIVARTPPLSQFELSPLVRMDGYRVGPCLETARPTVIIVSSSPLYAAQLRRSIERSRVLEMNGGHFELRLPQIRDEGGALWVLRVLGLTPLWERLAARAGRSGARVGSPSDEENPPAHDHEHRNQFYEETILRPTRVKTRSTYV